jgi:hypothetical protein
MKLLMSICCVLALATGFALANVKMSQPAPTPSIKPGKIVLHSSLEVIPDAAAYEARLQISQSTLNELRAAAGGGANAAVAVSTGQSGTRTIIAGSLMFLAISFAGVLFARSVRAGSFGRTQKAIAAVLLIVVVLGAAAIITHGNAGPPGSYRWRNLPQALREGQSTAGGVDIEIVPDDQMPTTKFRLLVPLKKNTNSGEE